MKIKCPQCGAKNDGPTNRCGVCGVGFTVDVKPDNQSFIFFLMVLVLIIVFASTQKCPVSKTTPTTSTTPSNITSSEEYEKYLREKK